jgi:hypothetical protein
VSNIIKPIRSNPAGHHIHSPFAFHLVTEVIFNEKETSEPDLLEFTGREKDGNHKYGLMFRLLKFFAPQKILIAGTGHPGLQEAIKKSLLPLQPVVTKELQNFHPADQDFVIWNSGVPEEFEIPGNISEAVWFIPDIHHPEMQFFFNKLKIQDNVTQTFELNSCGIIIFNPKFQKQDFVIKGKKSY